MKDIVDRGVIGVAVVGVVGLLATVTAGVFVHDRRTAIICASVAAVAIAALWLTYWLVSRMWQRQHDAFMWRLDGEGGEQ